LARSIRGWSLLESKDGESEIYPDFITCRYRLAVI